ncbi:bifunctional 2-keto-4-hydroxyglutarate aldolase/2-keto-3-deoxy-6-phosphogluconate aldolase [Streptococcus didelphis]|uniref:Bifunctional 2-keto-4-hydroxyglutarate aldolase/2-keto-3-deoxy-6-phosphogluconate aldolase n=1 Tax=Streptococcus didelphis TaxID=102886 RepID=A0ABY9LI14_9STRE|nr:bifunctional 2-keto-4-hydroxyglutarate aldolase/2-keto-3-deoxy-6-phosphogluconate aldolase [Streptococcus didelphis]WMB27795.1 bifunctional 2-keto-4-hydroxyglutarate aldolase/2-keto-3-deoxy-6-phosphogluconate aldolase [Streptococcus didelphis]WMB29743.1 bifunctional 2-keto-4-hydroxyglutarate aldolase/2-keto-3-deoxy-6-phosphogluconate aldolase [Streptococcus didelphis]
MTKSETISQLLAEKIVVVIRGTSQKEALQAARACIEGGIKVIEVAYTNPQASQIIECLTKVYASQEIIIGAGTVLDPQTARTAILAGAKFIVSPAFSSQTAKLCHGNLIPYLPGCMTPTEVTRALEHGCDLLKIFPAASLGPSHISSLKAALPHLQLMVTGGVNLYNAKDWFKAGASLIGIGGEFNKLASQGNYDAITEMAQKYHKLIFND